MVSTRHLLFTQMDHRGADVTLHLRDKLVETATL